MEELKEMFIGWKVAIAGIGAFVIIIATICLSYATNETKQNNAIDGLTAKIATIDHVKVQMDTVLTLLRSEK